MLEHALDCLATSFSFYATYIFVATTKYEINLQPTRPRLVLWTLLMVVSTTSLAFFLSRVVRWALQ